MPILSSIDLGAWMGRDLDENRATASVRLAEGWLLAATRLDPWPDLNTAGEDLRAWVMELAALAYLNNPREVTQRQTGGVLTAWTGDALMRREAILHAARARYNRHGLPQASSPDVNIWPDPALPWGGYGIQYL